MTFYTQILDNYRRVTPHELSMMFPALPEGYVETCILLVDIIT